MCVFLRRWRETGGGKAASWGSNGSLLSCSQTTFLPCFGFFFFFFFPLCRPSKVKLFDAVPAVFDDEGKLVFPVCGPTQSLLRAWLVEIVSSSSNTRRRSRAEDKHMGGGGGEGRGYLECRVNIVSFSVCWGYITHASCVYTCLARFTGCG